MVADGLGTIEASALIFVRNDCILKYSVICLTGKGTICRHHIGGVVLDLHCISNDVDFQVFVFIF